MRILAAFFIAITALVTVPASAQLLSIETYIEEWDERTQSWVRVEEGSERLVAASRGGSADALATYGPFRVRDNQTAELVGTTDHNAPRQFEAMLRDYPQLATLTLVEAPGTDDDHANLRLGRMIRAAGLATHVPAGGSARSGAIELLLAGKTRQIDDGAEFAVHSWQDEYGRQPQDFAMTAPENRIYLEYYQHMGMAAGHAQAFYDMTNSVDFKDVKWLTGQDMREWLGQKPASLLGQSAH